jgi:hypothetical protein
MGIFIFLPFSLFFYTGDETILKCLEDLVHKAELVGGMVDAEGSPIIKKKKVPKSGGKKKLKRTKKEVAPKSFSLGGICIKTEGDHHLNMIDLIQNAKGKGSKILASSTGELVKKIPCGFYPACLNTLDKGDTVIGGTVVLPAEHKGWEKQVFVCLDHEEDSTSGVEEGVDSITNREILVGVDNHPKADKQGEDTEGSSMDELESSIVEDNMTCFEEERQH